MVSIGIPSQTGNNSMFYPGEVPFRNQGTSTSPISMGTTETMSQQTTNKGGKVKISQNIQINTQPCPSTSGTGASVFHLETLVQVDHRYTAQLVVEITTTGRIVRKIIFAQNVGQGHTLHKCAVDLPIQVNPITFAYTVIAKTTLQVTVPFGPMTTRRNLDQHQGTSTILNDILEIILKIWSIMRRQKKPHKPKTG